MDKQKKAKELLEAMEVIEANGDKYSDQWRSKLNEFKDL